MMDSPDNRRNSLRANRATCRQLPLRQLAALVCLLSLVVLISLAGCATNFTGQYRFADSRAETPRWRQEPALDRANLGFCHAANTSERDSVDSSSLEIDQRDSREFSGSGRDERLQLETRPLHDTTPYPDELSSTDLSEQVGDLSLIVIPFLTRNPYLRVALSILIKLIEPLFPEWAKWVKDHLERSVSLEALWSAQRESDPCVRVASDRGDQSELQIAHALPAPCTASCWRQGRTIVSTCAP